jgi:hypothetical protein
MVQLAFTVAVGVFVGLWLFSKHLERQIRKAEQQHAKNVARGMELLRPSAPLRSYAPPKDVSNEASEYEKARHLEFLEAVERERVRNTPGIVLARQPKREGQSLLARVSYNICPGTVFGMALFAVYLIWRAMAGG